MKAKFLTLFLGGLLLFSCDSKKKTPKYQEFEGIAGTVEYRVKYISTDTTSLKSSVDSIVRVIDNSLSVYNEESILSKINNTIKKCILLLVKYGKKVKECMTLPWVYL